MNKSDLTYTGMPLDRAVDRRIDEEWINEQFQRSDALIIPLWKNLNLTAIAQSGERVPEIAYLSKDTLGTSLTDTSETVFIGLLGSTPVFCSDFSELDKNTITSCHLDCDFHDLRAVGSEMKMEEAAILAYVRSIMHWHRQNRFCGQCGGETKSCDGGHMLACKSSSCGNKIFPRTDPVVVMFIEKETKTSEPPQCLLGCSGRFGKKAYSALAGFLDPGESMEEAVAREVYEEVGICVKDIQYIASQPWPYPSSIMLAFSVKVEADAVIHTSSELSDAKWFTVEEVLNAGEWGDDSVALQLPRSDSMARFLINNWLENIGEPMRFGF